MYYDTILVELMEQLEETPLLLDQSIHPAKYILRKNKLGVTFVFKKDEKEEDIIDYFSAIRQKKSTGQNRSAFCKQHGPSKSVYYYWHTRGQNRGQSSRVLKGKMLNYSGRTA